MSNVYEEITRWAIHGNLPFWEQAALDRILGGGVITEEVVEELVDYLLEDAELKEKTRIRPNLKNLAAGAANVNAANDRYRLASIHNLQNINALVPNQRLEFGENLTVVFGSNGSGKSGYARVIGSAAFSRGDKQILGNVTAAQQLSSPLSADIDLVSSDGQIMPIHYVVGEPCPKLRSFYVFDSTSVKNHLTKENPMSFSPAGLEALTTLSTLTDQVRKSLEEKCVQKDCSRNVFDPLYIGETRVKGHIKILSENSDLAVLEKLANLTEKEKDRVAQLELQIADIHSQRIQETIDQLDQEIRDLGNLRDSLKPMEAWLNSGELLKVNELVNEYVLCEKAIQAAQQTGATGFSHATPDASLWDRFIRAAYALGQAESRLYPADGDRCLLCDQPLSGEAQNLVRRIWDSINSESETQKRDIDQALSACASTIQRFPFEILDAHTSAHRWMQRIDPDALQLVRANLAEFKKICDQVNSAIVSHRPINVNPLRVIGSAIVQSVIDHLQGERQKLVDRNTEQTLQQLEKERLELQHRLLLAGQMESIKDYVQRAKWVKQASSPAVKRSTKHITQKYNDLFDQLVTQRYIQLFEQTLVKLKCPLRVKVETRGSKGETKKQIVLMRDNNESCCDASPDKVLSEGEQRAVALADFLTEVALNDRSCGILLDDPVTSLDFQWKETIAQHIAEESNRQQVIVFTHDLHFLYCLKKYAKECCVNLTTHWIEKRDGFPGWVFLNQSPTDEKDYKKLEKANAHLKRAKEVSINPEERQFYLQQGFGALRTSYEAFIIFEIFGGVVQRFEERISPGSLKKVATDRSILSDLDEGYGRISRFIEGHLHSDESAIEKPTPDLLVHEIAVFEEIRNRHKAYKISQGIKD